MSLAFGAKRWEPNPLSTAEDRVVTGVLGSVVLLMCFALTIVQGQLDDDRLAILLVGAMFSLPVTAGMMFLGVVGMAHGQPAPAADELGEHIFSLIVSGVLLGLFFGALAIPLVAEL